MKPKYSDLIIVLVYLILSVLVKISNGQGDEDWTEVPTTVIPQATPVTLPSANATAEDNEVVPARHATNNNEVLLRDLDSELDSWEASYDIRKNYPYYFAGFDYDDKPLWIAELGKFNVRKLVEDKRTEEFDKYIKQAAHRMVQSHKIRDKNNYQIAVIADFEGLRFHQIASVDTVVYILKLASQYRILLEDHVTYVYVVNANFVTEQLINLVKPILGRILEHFQVFGSNKARWVPHLLRQFPKSALPEYLGGSKDFTPVAVYG